MAGVQQTLTQLREVEGVTGPLYCLASAKFLGKLAGLYDSAKHLSDFIQSPWAQRNGSISKIKAAWGHCDSASVEDFNQRVLKSFRQSNLAHFDHLIWPTTSVVRLVEIPAAVGAVGKVGIARVVRDFQGRWEARKTCFWVSSLSTDRLFPQPGGRRVFVFEKTWIVT